MPTEHFESKEAYRKNMAYRHMHGIPFTAKNVVVAGKEHEVKHSSNPGRKRIDAKQKEHVHEHLNTDHLHGETHRGKTVDGHDHDGHVAGTMPAHKHHGLMHHYTHHK